MKVYIAKFEKIEEYSVQHGCDLTILNIALHPVINIQEGKASISSLGVEPSVLLEGKVIEHTYVSRALRDVADLIDNEFNNKTAEDMKIELEKE